MPLYQVIMSTSDGNVYELDLRAPDAPSAVRHDGIRDGGRHSDHQFPVATFSSGQGGIAVARSL